MKRTNAQPIGDVLQEFFSQPYIAAKIAEGRLPETWREVVGERAAAATVELRLERYVLYARITSSAIRHELFLRRDSIASELNRLAGVKFVNVVIIR
ncbi:MAG: DUF721 domain-containing protein [Alistipes sp.]|nr:DUF721 domain-containing protein [Alistipes sp.]